MEIICPYCFEKFTDDKVHFRSEKFYKDVNEVLPEGFDNVEEFTNVYNGFDKKDILEKIEKAEFFKESEDEKYEKFWEDFNGTTEEDASDEYFGIKSYHRKVIDPENKDDQKFLWKDENAKFLIKDNDGMVSKIKLRDGEICDRRVCPHCHNPLPTEYGKTDVKFVTIIGISGAGKTVYISQLLKRMSQYAAKVGLTAMVNTPSVKAFLEKNEVTANKPLPSSTETKRLQQPLFYEIISSTGGNSRKTDTLVLYDVAGEVFNDERFVEKIAPFIKHSDGLITLIDPNQFENIAQLNGENQLVNPTKVFEAIHNVVSQRAGDKCKKPVAVCLSKVDSEAVQQSLNSDLQDILLNELEGVRDEKGLCRPVFNASQYNKLGEELSRFITSNQQDLALVMNNNYVSFAYFAFTSLGCLVQKTDDGMIPVGPILPKRIEEPLLWLTYRFGYIDSTEPVYESDRIDVLCPKCDSSKCVKKLSEVKEGKHFFKKVMCDCYCKNCMIYFDSNGGGWCRG